MSAGESNWRLSTSLASRLGAHLPVIEAVVERLQSFAWSEKDVFAIQLALEESLTNAVRHGNKHDCTKSVHVECEVSGTRFWAHIRDEGEGFCPEDVPDPTADENVTACGGRGLLLIKTYMTDVCYSPPGNCVTLLKLRQRDLETADESGPES
jgi:serine/threonine-protein kinase RsbW